METSCIMNDNGDYSFKSTQGPFKIQLLRLRKPFLGQELQSCRQEEPDCYGETKELLPFWALCTSRFTSPWEKSALQGFPREQACFPVKGSPLNTLLLIELWPPSRDFPHLSRTSRLYSGHLYSTAAVMAWRLPTLTCIGWVVKVPLHT